MHAHKIKIVVTDDHEVRVKLPSDFPAGNAELIVIADIAATSKPAGTEAAGDFKRWLDTLLSEVPRVPALPSEAFDRSTIYDD